MKKIECYETEDGRLFTTYEEAILHEKEEIIKRDLEMILKTSIRTSDLLKQYVGNSHLCTDIVEAGLFKTFLVNYMAKIMLKDFAAFKSLFDGGLSCK